jgi:hypothetical protein
MPGARKYPVELLERPTERPHESDVLEGGGGHCSSAFGSTKHSFDCWTCARPGLRNNSF